MDLQEKLTFIEERTMENLASQQDEELKKIETSLKQISLDHQDKEQQRYQEFFEQERESVFKKKNRIKSELDLKAQRQIKRREDEMTNQIFADIEARLKAFKETKEYPTYLVNVIRNDLSFDPKESFIFYIDPSDSHLLDFLKENTGTDIRISDRDFIGGVRGVIAERRILFDDSFLTKLERKRSDFTYDWEGLDGID